MAFIRYVKIKSLILLKKEKLIFLHLSSSYINSQKLKMSTKMRMLHLVTVRSH